jgi:hypothetical protein
VYTSGARVLPAVGHCSSIDLGTGVRSGRFLLTRGVPARIFANIPVTMAGNLQDFLKTNDLERLVTHRAAVCYYTGSCQGLLTFA